MEFAKFAVVSCLLLLLKLCPGGAAPSWGEGLEEREAPGLGPSTRWTPDASVSRVTSPLAMGEGNNELLERNPRQVGVPEGNTLIFANRLFIVSLKTDESFPIVNGTYLESGSNAIGLDFDFRQNKLFWSDVNQKVIFMSELDVTGVQILVNTGIETPDGLAWDWVGKNLYWTDAAEHHIAVVDPRNPTTHRKILIATGDRSIPRAIVVDPHEGNMYWTDWGNAPKIERASMDGTDHYTLFDSTDLGWPNGLTLDYATQTLYWIDAKFDKIETASVNGDNRQQLPTPSNTIFHPFGLVFHHGYLYWSDWALNAILSAPVSDIQSGVSLVLTRLLLDPMAVHVIAADRQPSGPADHLCENAGCSHLCLLSSATGYTCTCPNGLVLDSDQKTCRHSCIPECFRGTCMENNECSCPNGWTGNRCQRAVCFPICRNGGTCTAPNVCQCPTGYSGRNCAAICSGGCGHGQCTRPEVCECDNGWTGTNCDIPICYPSCENGMCSAPNECNCNYGWTSQLCQQPICSGWCEHGQCTRPEVCECDNGWTGTNCDIPICEPECVHGYCSQPGVCECSDGYTGTYCHKAQCFPQCQNGGTCTANVCQCPTGYSGRSCAVREVGQNGG